MSPIENIRSYYQGKVATLGPTPAGVDWGSAKAQVTRFDQLIKLIPQTGCTKRPTLNDLGCGYGALLARLISCGINVDYLGIDLVPDMINFARQRFIGLGEFVEGHGCSRLADYSVASGLFNVCHEAPKAEWESFIVEVLDDLDSHSLRGFAFNCLTSYSDPEKMRPGLYYGNPLWFFDLCKQKYAKNVALLHDYELYDFTIIVRKDAAF